VKTGGQWENEMFDDAAKGQNMSVYRQKPECKYYGGDGDCPHCKAVDALDTPIKKGVVHWAAHGYTVHCVLDFRQCKSCGLSSYAVTLALIDNPDVGDEWSNKYFWSDRPKHGRTRVGTMCPGWKIRGFPKQWCVSRTETRAGVLERHFFGPFPGVNEPGVWALNGSARGPWEHAVWIFYKFLVRLPAVRKG
jgi:hypothetical protein